MSFGSHQENRPASPFDRTSSLRVNVAPKFAPQANLRIVAKQSLKSHVKGKCTVCTVGHLGGSSYGNDHQLQMIVNKNVHSDGLGVRTTKPHTQSSSELNSFSNHVGSSIMDRLCGAQANKDPSSTVAPRLSASSNMAQGSRTRIEQAFANAKKRGEAALIPYICCGYPSPTATVDILLAMQHGGAHVIELGVPHSNPFMDGPTLQNSHKVAMKNGITGTRDSLKVLSLARRKGLTVPVVIMGYYEGFLKEFCGSSDQLCLDAAENGADGILAIGIPQGTDEQEFNISCYSHGISSIQIILPGSSIGRVKELCEMSSSFIYLVSDKGKTGVRPSLPESLEERLQTVRSFTEIPIVVGFGISTPEMVQSVSLLSDGAVIGSFLTDCINKECLNGNGFGREPALIMQSHISDLRGGVIQQQSKTKNQATKLSQVPHPI